MAMQLRACCYGYIHSILARALAVRRERDIHFCKYKYSAPYVCVPAPPRVAMHRAERLAAHTVSRGLILNCLLMRIDPQRRTMGEFLAQETSPLSVEVFCGMPN
jgi:hypothetical protein